MLLNIISNSVKFTKHGKILIRFSLNSVRNELKIIISDTGLGIKDEDKRKLFKDFVMLESSSHQNPLGSGLGLSICKSLAYKLNIKLDFDSEYGKGSDFFVYVPLNKSVQVSEAIDDLTSKDNLCLKNSEVGFKNTNSHYQNENSISNDYSKTFIIVNDKNLQSELENEERKEINKCLYFNSKIKKPGKLQHSSKELRRLKYSLSDSNIINDVVYIYFFILYSIY